MALRLIEAVLPAGSDVDDIMADHDVIGRWTEALDGGLSLLRALVPAERTESLSDALCDRFGHNHAFRLMLLPVEGTLPKVAEPEPDDADRADRGKEPERVSREELYQDVAGSARLNATYILGVVLSTVVAAVGLVNGDVAVIIGAMVIAPLLGPNVALALATTLGDRDLLLRSARVAGAGVSTALAISIVCGAALLLLPDVGGHLIDRPEIAARARVGPEHALLALAAGSAGALAFTTGIPAALIGVMVAVALLPPTVVAGLLLGSGNFTGSIGALGLVLTNVACVNLAGMLTFMAQRVRPRTWWEEEKARRATRVAIAMWAATLLVLAAAVFLSLDLTGP